MPLTRHTSNTGSLSPRFPVVFVIVGGGLPYTRIEVYDEGTTRTYICDNSWHPLPFHRSTAYQLPFTCIKSSGWSVNG